MARTSWLPRLHDIRRSVRESVRSHYSRADIQYLFELQPRAAQKLMRMVSIGAKVGQSALVSRLALADFLSLIYESEDPEATLQAKRNEPSPAPRRALRELVQVDSDPATLDTMPRNIELSTGKVVIEYGTVEQLAGSLLAMSQVLERELEEFAEKYEPVVEVVKQDDSVAEDLKRAFAQLRRDEQAKAELLRSPLEKVA